MMKIIFVVISAFLIILAGCTQENTTVKPPQKEVFLNQDNSTDISEGCQSDKVIMIKSKYCSHCKETLPIFLEACEEKGVEPMVWDVSLEPQRKLADEYDIDYRFVPVFVFGCEEYVGVKSKEEYLAFLDKFLGDNNSK